VHRACTLHELVTVLCAAVGFTDDEHLYRFQTTREDFSPWELGPYSSDGPVTSSLQEIGFRTRDGLHLHYDMGDKTLRGVSRTQRPSRRGREHGYHSATR
jgi:hypothetical protein